MIFNIKKILSHLLFPLSGISFLLAGYTFLRINKLVEHQYELDESLENLSYFVTQINAIPNANSIDEVPLQSTDELLEAHKRQNKELKERSQKISPNKSRFAYFQKKFTGDSISNIGDEDYTSVIIEDGGETVAVFQGDYHLSYIEWLDDRELVVYRSCGTECMIGYIVDSSTKDYQELSLGVGYTWSPNNQYVVAYHYSSKYGISIANRGNQYGQTVFELRREHSPKGSSLSNQTRVAWSSDSTKLAVVIQKTDEERLELLVYDIENKFKTLFQHDLEGSDVSNLAWEGFNTLALTEDNINKKITF